MFDDDFFNDDVMEEEFMAYMLTHPEEDPFNELTGSGKSYSSSQPSTAQGSNKQEVEAPLGIGAIIAIVIVTFGILALCWDFIGPLILIILIIIFAINCIKAVG